uniref:LOW QUALITY PROTEIN: translation initiation factor eIF-2B subunit beta-like n=1 Tax=Styela clava TaxID=7725 RepID=UPI001939858E|nr:LOW QUALITY PROTEIN: translation initiation factor eIF-2B subunit beta-like [Styela clava]
MDLKQDRFKSSYETVCKTINYLRHVISAARFSHAKDLMKTIQQEGKKIIALQPSAYVVGNMVRRVLKIIREEYARLRGLSEESVGKESLHRMLTTSASGDDFLMSLKELKITVMEAIKEYLDELEVSIHNISAQAIEHIHSNEVVLTIGKSRTVEAFLKQAAKTRKFHVIVVEGAPNFEGHILAKSLAESGIETTIITDSAVFAIMSRVNKVIIGTHSILANGGLKAVVGTRLVALAAKRHAVPLIVLAAMYKLCPMHYADSAGKDAMFNRLTSPQAVLDYGIAGSNELCGVQVYSPMFDYVPPELVTLFISNIGGNAPSYMYRLLSELYHPDDHEL